MPIGCEQSCVALHMVTSNVMLQQPRGSMLQDDPVKKASLPFAFLQEEQLHPSSS